MLPRIKSSQILIFFFRNEDSTDSLGNVFQWLTTFTIKMCFLVFRCDFMGFVPGTPLLLLDTTENSLALSSLSLPIRYSCTLLRPSLSHLFTSFFSSSLWKRCFSPIIIFVALHWTFSSKYIFFLHWELRIGPSSPDVASLVLNIQGWPAGNALSDAVQDTVGLNHHNCALLVHGRLVTIIHCIGLVKSEDYLI